VDIPHEFPYLAELSAALGDPGDDLPAVLEVLVDDLMTAVPSFLGLSITLFPGEDAAQDTTGVTLDFLPPSLFGAVRTSLLVPLGAQGGAGPGGTVVFYAGRAGAFVDLAADTRSACHLGGQVTLDQHLPSAGTVGTSGTFGPTEAGIINRAIGVLIGRGRTPEEARRILHRRADQDKSTLHRAAQRLLDRQASRRRFPVAGPTLEDDIPFSLMRFACSSVIPGCGEVFTAVSDQGVLDQVLAHATSEHGMAAPGLPFIEWVMAHTQPVSPHQRHPRSTGTDKGALPDGPAAVRVLPSNVYPLRPQNRVIGPGFGGAHETYRHECVFYTGTDGFLYAMLPFVRDGLARQEPVLVAVTEPRLQALRSALGDDADDVIFADMAQLGHNPALIIPAWREFTDRHSGPGRPVRGIGEPIWAGRRPAELAEAQFHEALLNVAVPPDIPLWLLCPYDTAALDHQIIAEAQRSHPVLVEINAYRASTHYGGAAHAEHIFGRPLPPPQAPPTVIPFDPRHYRHVQRTLRAATSAGLPVHRATRLAVAVDELAHTADQNPARVTIRLWPDRTGMICEVTDPGTVQDPMIGRGPGPGPFPPRERAIRLANELCDLVQIRSRPTGTTTRIHAWR